MLSRRKKQSESAAAGLRWHPDFRVQSRLPDTKVVRTAFFFNGLAALGVLALSTYLIFSEWQLHVVRVQIGEAEALIARHKPTSAQALGLFRKFQAEETRLREIDAFVSGRPQLSVLLVHLTEILPPNLALDMLDWRETGLLLRLTVKGAPDVASGEATAFRDRLAADTALAFFGEPTIASLTTNPATGRLVAEITLPVKGKK